MPESDAPRWPFPDFKGARNRTAPTQSFRQTLAQHFLERVSLVTDFSGAMRDARNSASAPAQKENAS
jgi:hypothetical protein